MKKKAIYFIGKKYYNLDIHSINQIIIKNLNIDNNKLFFIENILNYSDIIKDFRQFKLGYPFYYILGKVNFYGHDFIVNENVLIPRNDSEVLVLEGIKVLKNNIIDNIIDIGTGTSCIPISIILEKKITGKTYVIDISKKALKVSNKNIIKYNLNNIFIQINSDLLKKIFEKKIDLGKTILITANLPYIKNGDLENMDKSVYKYEPKVALFGGKNTGFELYERLIEEIYLIKEIYLIEKIFLIIEIGFDQYEYSKYFLEKKGLKFEYFKDMNNIYRIIKIEF